MTDANNPNGPNSPNRWKLLLIVPVVVALLVPLYNREDPEIGGVPFFYWYQMLCIPVGVACTLVVYRKTRERADG